MMRKLQKNKMNFVNYIFILLGSFMLGSCQTTTEFYEYALTSGTWQSQEYITTASGTEAITYKQRFFSDGYYTLQINHPTSGNIDHVYLYSLGYQSPKFAVVLHSQSDPQVVVGLPIYYYFEDTTLVTSTNSGMAQARRWERVAN